MRKILLGSILLVALALGALAQFSFYPIDNFENGSADKWYKFGNVQLEVVPNASAEARDAVAESCGDYSLRLSGRSDNWYVGGVGAELGIDATLFSRLQMDIYGGPAGGKLKIELYDDDNGNYSLEQDPARDWLATKDDKWGAEVPILGKGFTRVSIPFSAFKLENPGGGNGVWDPDQNNNSGGLLKIQLILLTNDPSGEADLRIDNLILTY